MSGIEGLLAGRVLAERYHIERVIGRGGMGAVYRATDQRLGRAVAVKVIMLPSGDAESRERLRQRFVREAQAAARIHHPNVVTVYDFGTDAELGLDFLVMELLDGEDLSARVGRAGPMPAHEALDLLEQAARGLAVGHRSGLVHRDVKPGNLFLGKGEHDEETRVRILDFGIVQAALDELTLTHLTVAGRGPLSPAYASPEQLRGESRLTAASDVFSLGAVGIYALTGARPFAGSAEAGRVGEEVAAALGRLEEVPGVEPEVREVLRRALSPDPTTRYPGADAFLDALRAARRGEAPPPLAARASPPPVVAAPMPLPPTLSSDVAPMVPPPEDVTEPSTHRPAAYRDDPLPALRKSRWVAPALAGAVLLAAAAVVAREIGPWAPGSGGAAPAAGDTALAVLDTLRVQRAQRDSAPREEPRDTVNLDSVRVDTVRQDTAPAPAPLPEPPGDRVYRLEEVDVHPQLRNERDVRRQLARRYPGFLRDQGIAGQALIHFVVDEEGRVDEGSIRVGYATRPEFEQAAIEVVQRMRFEPAQLGGRAVKVRAQMPLAWKPSD